MTLLTVSGLSKKEGNGISVNNISFQQEEFRKLAIAGETGAGKSTLLKLLAGLLQPDGGTVYLGEERVKGPAEKLVAGHPQIAYLSQQFELPGFLRVEQVLQYANSLAPAQAQELYALCRIGHLLQRKTDQLSGGEKQRIALARLLSASPRLLLLDEPFSNLDLAHKRLLKAVLHDISQSLRISCSMVSHDPLDSLSWADEILVLKGGELQQTGSPRQIYQRPVNEYVAGLFGHYTLVPANKTGAFQGLPGIESNGKKLLVRPESVIPVAESPAALQGTVRSIYYYGSHYELDIALPSTSLLMRTAAAHYQVGDRIWVGLQPEAIWYLS
jgi:ABC-type Fe3+/spermidine/putrescine transport system ATPase subunit